MAEGIFPKADGEVLYGTEASRIPQGGFTLYRNDFLWVGSTAESTLGNSVGSFVIPAGSVQPNTIFELIASTDFTRNGAQSGRINLRLSGAGFGADFTRDDGATMNSATNIGYVQHITGVLTSGTFSSAYLQFVHKVPGTPGINSYLPPFFNCHPGSGFIVELFLNTSGTSFGAGSNTISNAILNFRVPKQ